MASQKQQVVVMVDQALLRQVDALTGDRNQAIEEALYLWCQQQSDPPFTQRRPQTPGDYHRQRHNDDETGWLV